MGRLRRHPRAISVAVLFLALNSALAYFSVVMHPLPKGTPEAFWDVMYRLKLGKHDYFGGVYPSRDGICIYYYQGYHGQFIYGVALQEVEGLLPDVQRRALLECSLLSANERVLLTAQASVDRLVMARIARAASEDTSQSLDAADDRRKELEEFEIRWKRIKRYWLNILFEASFLNALLFLIAFPFVRQSSPMWWKAISAGLAFPLLFMPFFLGYCPWTFSSAGPVGGALYPWIIVLFSGCSWGMTPLDGLLIKGSGLPLEPLSQSPGPMWSVSGMGGMAPTFTLVIGILVGMGVGFFSQVLCLARVKWLTRRNASQNTEERQ